MLVGTPEYGLMKESRSDFVSALHYCRENENNNREVQTINPFRNKDFKTFWKQISVRNKLRYESVDGVSSKDQVSELFADNFSAY